MRTKDKKKILKLNKKANDIYNDESLEWEKKYDKIFSDKISSKLWKLIQLDYYDPDTSYQDDVMAFIDAFNDYVQININND